MLEQEDHTGMAEVLTKSDESNGYGNDGNVDEAVLDDLNVAEQV
jgi:hypothetical protein